jgi:iron complex outermembrane receptor protein
MAMQRIFTGVAAVVGSLLVSTFANAQDAGAVSPFVGERSSEIPEIVVTARRREESLQNVPIAVTAFTGDQLKEQSVTTVSDLQRQVPGLIMQEARDDPQSVVVTLRGRRQEDVTLAVDPSVSLNIDGLYVPRTLGLAGSLLDISRVEVLRGPQGTLYGRNTTGGAVGLFTNDPTDQLSGSMDMTGGNYGAWDVIGIANIPIIGDTLDARFVAERGGHGGYQHNSTDTPLADENAEYYRAKLRWKILDKWTAILSAHYETNQSGTFRLFVSGLTPPNFQNNGLPEGGALTLETLAENPNLSLPQALALLKTWVANRQTPLLNNTGGPRGFSDIDRWDVGLSVNGNLSKDVQFRSITGFQHLIRDELLGTQSALNYITSVFYSQDKYVSQEFQILGVQPRLNWVVGMYGGVEDGQDDQDTLVLPGVLGPAPGINDNGIRNSSVAGFGQATWEFVPTWHLTIGGRYTADRRKIDATALSGAACVIPAPGFESTAVAGAPTQCPRAFQSSFAKPTWLVSLDHLLTSDTLAYVKIATGYRSGGENESGAVEVETFAPFAPETDLEYETGLKSEFFDHRVRLNLALYRDQYSNLQVQTQFIAADGAFATIERNAAMATVNGMEAELDVKIGRGLSVHASGTLTDAHYVQFTDASGDRSHEPFSVPKRTWSLSGKYVQPTVFGDFLLQLDYDWKSSVDLAGHAVLRSQVTQPAYGLLNARANLHLNRADVDIALFGKNITNVNYIDQAAPVEGAGFNVGFPGVPAIFGVEVIKKFGR